VRQLEVEWSSDESRTVVRLAGHFDAEAEREVRAITTVADAAPGIHIDLLGVRFVDEAGLHLVEELASHPAIVVRATSPAIVQMLDLTRDVTGEWPTLRQHVIDLTDEGSPV
jgi:anti-anti-sigma regulatory factor